MSKDIANKVLDLAIQIQQVPSPTFQERNRAEFMRTLFEKEGLVDIEIDEIGNVYGRLPGKSSEDFIVVSAHTDTVFSIDTDLTIQRQGSQVIGPGIGDNSMGTAGLIGLIWKLREENLQVPGDIWFAANVGEEGLGDLRGMRAVVDRFEDKPSAYLILEGMGLGMIYHAGLGVRRYKITAKTAGGHSWTAYGKPSAIHELAELITQLTAIKLPTEPRTTLNIGVIQGGTSINTIAARASLELDLRSEDGKQLEELYKRVEHMVREANAKDKEVSFIIETIGDRPMGKLDKEHRLIKIAQSALEKQGVEPEVIVGSTDANIPLSRGLPAICIGLTIGRRSHTIDEYIEIEPIEKGINQLTEIVKNIFEA